MLVARQTHRGALVQPTSSPASMAVLTTMLVQLLRRYQRKCKRLPGRQRMKRWPSTSMPISDQLWLEGVSPGHPFGGVQRGTRRAGSQSVLTQLGQGRRKLCAQRRFARGGPARFIAALPAAGGRRPARTLSFLQIKNGAGRAPRGPRAAAARSTSRLGGDADPPARPRPQERTRKIKGHARRRCCCFCHGSKIASSVRSRASTVGHKSVGCTKCRGRQLAIAAVQGRGMTLGG